MEEKKSNGLVVVAIILSLIIGGIGGYFLTTNFLSKNEINNESNTSNENKTTENKNITVYSTADPKVSKLIDNLIIAYDDIIMSCTVGIWEFANDKKIETKDISSVDAFEMVDKYEDLNKDGKITSDEIEKSIQKILGKDFKFDSNVNIQKCGGASYDPKTKELYYGSDQCGGDCGFRYSAMPFYKLVKAVDIDGILEIELKAIFENENKKIYSDYSKKNLIATYDEENNQFLNSKKEVISLDELLNKGSDYKFTFKSEDGNYVFVSSEPIN